MIKELKECHAQQFADLIVDMYGHLENLEWFSPMPYDIENVKAIINNPRFYIVGYFEGDILCAVSSFDYKCGKLIGKIDFPKECNTDKLVEFGFTMVHSKYQGNGIMKKLVAFLIEKAKAEGLEWAFGKVHKDNARSFKSLMHNGFEKYNEYRKKVNIEDFKSLSSQPFFSSTGKENAKKTLSAYTDKDTEIIVDYNIFMKKL